MSREGSPSSSARESLLRKRPASLRSDEPTRASRFEDITPQVVSRWDLTKRAAAAPLIRPPTATNWDRSERAERLGLAAPEAAKPEAPAAGPGPDARNAPWTDARLDELLAFPGFEVVRPPPDYKPLRVSRGAAAVYALPERHSALGQLPAMRNEDLEYFAGLIEGEDGASRAELRERRVLALLLQVKNGNAQLRKQAMKTLGEKARELGAELLLGKLLPLVMMGATADPWERHMLLKALERVLFRLGAAARPYAANVIAVAEPMLVDEDAVLRAEGRELVANLAKAAGMPAVIGSVRKGVDAADDGKRAATARVIAVAACALGVPTFSPFLAALCGARRHELGRHTGCRAVQQIAVLLGAGTLPHLKPLSAMLAPLLGDESARVRAAGALAAAQLLEAVTPFGGEASAALVEGLWRAAGATGGRGLAPFLRALSAAVALYDGRAQAELCERLCALVQREAPSAIDELLKAMFRAVAEVCRARAYSPAAARAHLLPLYFEHFWQRRFLCERAAGGQLLAAGVALGRKTGLEPLAERLCPVLRAEAEEVRVAAARVLRGVIAETGLGALSAAAEDNLLDAAIFAFHQAAADPEDDLLLLLADALKALGLRARRHLPPIVANACIRLKTRAPRVRQQAAELLARALPALELCQEDKLFAIGTQVLFENIGEEFPEVLAAILGALHVAVAARGPRRLAVPLADLLPALTPILKNRHERVQLQLVGLIGRVARVGGESVAPKEWIKICFELIDTLKAPQKSVRRAAVRAFGDIARAVGPQDVVLTLINNLKVQERQMRICTTVAIAVVASACGPFTVIPALMNEYRVPIYNIQNGVLKSFAFMFEYIGEGAKDYIYAVVPLLEDALLDRDLVKRQTASACLKHLALGVAGFGCEDALLHLFNMAVANLFEASPHIVNAVVEAVEGLRVAVGPGHMLLYVLQGLFHPARRVRDVYWRLYNTLYVGAQNSLTPFYPSLDGDAGSDYPETLYWSV